MASEKPRTKTKEKRMYSQYIEKRQGRKKKDLSMVIRISPAHSNALNNLKHG